MKSDTASNVVTHKQLVDGVVGAIAFVVIDTLITDIIGDHVWDVVHDGWVRFCHHIRRRYHLARLFRMHRLLSVSHAVRHSWIDMLMMLTSLVTPIARPVLRLIVILSCLLSVWHEVRRVR